MSNLLDKLGRWSNCRVLVVGDFMLDQTVYGNADRLSPEAPVPVLDAQRTEQRPGGAANLCLDLAAMRASVRAFGLRGQDDAGQSLIDGLAAASVDASAIVADAARPTTRKQRLVGLAQHRHPQAMFRVDFESRAPLPPACAATLLSAFEAALKDADAVCIEDYNKGVCTPEICQAVIRAARARGVPVLVDPASIADFSKYRGAATMTPNRSEACLGAGIRVPDGSPPSAYEPVARRLLDSLELEAAVITLDRDGALLLDRAGPAQIVPTVARTVYDVTGAGDMVLAALTAARCNGMSWLDSVRLANIAAGLEVQVFGVKPIPIEEIHREAIAFEQAAGESGGFGSGSAGGGGRTKVHSLEDVLVYAAALRAGDKPGRIVFTNGCFDVLHAGHLSLLRRAAAFGDFLVIGLNSDASVSRLKGPARPINTQADRAELLAGLECVGAVVIFDDETPERLVRAIRPDVLVKGAEYNVSQVPGAAFVLESGGRVELLEMVEGRSTTATVQRIRSA